MHWRLESHSSTCPTPTTTIKLTHAEHCLRCCCRSTGSELQASLVNELLSNSSSFSTTSVDSANAATANTAGADGVVPAGQNDAAANAELTKQAVSSYEQEAGIINGALDKKTG